MRESRPDSIRVVRRDVVIHDRPAISVGINFRSGYYGYDLVYRDERFLYGYYLFDYDVAQCAFSPWYYYPSLPGYVALNKVNFRTVSLRPSLDRRTRYIDNDSQLDPAQRNAVADFQDGLERDDTRALARLIPNRYEVSIEPPTGRAYSLDSDDFYDLMSDMTANVHTRRFDVLDIQTGRDALRIFGQQVFMDPWGHQLTEYMRVTMVADGDGYRIAELDTDSRAF